MVIVGNLACLGFHTSVIRFIPEYRERGMLAELRGIVLASRLFVLIASTLIAGLGALGVWLVSPWHRKLLCRAVHPRRHLPADDRAVRRAARPVARQFLGAVRAVADLSGAAGADPGVHGADAPDRRLRARRQDRDLRLDRRHLCHHARSADRRHRPHRRQDPGRADEGHVRARGSSCRCRSSWSKASSSCSPMPTC